MQASDPVALLGRAARCVVGPDRLGTRQAREEAEDVFPLQSQTDKGRAGKRGCQASHINVRHATWRHLWPGLNPQRPPLASLRRALTD